MTDMDTSRVVRMLNADDGEGMYNLLAAFARSRGASYDSDAGRWIEPKEGGTRQFCPGLHICHHWFEDECSLDCDAGKHRHPHGSCDQ